MILALVFALTLGGTQQTGSQALDSAVRVLLESNRRPLTVTAGTIAGAGGEWFLERAAAAQFTLLGESHLNRETPELAEALLRQLRGAGYSTYVIETGPETTRLLMDEVRTGGLAAGEALLTAFPFTVAFLDHREELRAAANAMELGYDVWGVDQEFMGSARVLLRRLRELAPDAAARQLAQDMFERAIAGYQRFATTGDQSGVFMATATAEDFAQLAAAFATSPEAERIVTQLRASAAVYRAYFERRFYDNNATRVDLIRRNFLAHLHRAGETPLSARRALIKAGSVHTGRGRTPMHVFDVGALAAEMAFTTGHESFHVLVLATGSVNAEGIFRSWRDEAPYLAPMIDLTAESPVVFDLRPLRALLTQQRGKSSAMEELQDVVLRFDALVMFPRFHPADAIVPLPRR